MGPQICSGLNFQSADYTAVIQKPSLLMLAGRPLPQLTHRTQTVKERPGADFSLDSTPGMWFELYEPFHCLTPHHHFALTSSQGGLLPSHAPQLLILDCSSKTLLGICQSLYDVSSAACGLIAAQGPFRLFLAAGTGCTDAIIRCISKKRQGL